MSPQDDIYCRCIIESIRLLDSGGQVLAMTHCVYSSWRLVQWHLSNTERYVTDWCFDSGSSVAKTNRANKDSSVFLYLVRLSAKYYVIQNCGGMKRNLHQWAIIVQHTHTSNRTAYLIINKYLRLWLCMLKVISLWLDMFPHTQHNLNLKTCQCVWECVCDCVTRVWRTQLQSMSRHYIKYAKCNTDSDDSQCDGKDMVYISQAAVMYGCHKDGYKVDAEIPKKWRITILKTRTVRVVIYKEMSGLGFLAIWSNATTMNTMLLDSKPTHFDSLKQGCPN